MSHFKRRIADNLYLLADQFDDGSWKIVVVDSKSEPVESEPERVAAVLAAYREESSLRAALWAELPPEVQAAVRDGLRHA